MKILLILCCFSLSLAVRSQNHVPADSLKIWRQQEARINKQVDLLRQKADSVDFLMIRQDSLAQVASAKNDQVSVARYQKKKKSLEHSFDIVLVQLDSTLGARNALQSKLQTALKKN